MLEFLDERIGHELASWFTQEIPATADGADDPRLVPLLIQLGIERAELDTYVQAREI